MNRRSFLIRGVSTLVALTPLLSSLLGCRSTSTQLLGSPKTLGLSASDLHLLAAVQAHLFPSEPDAPGAKDINALNYLKSFHAYHLSETEDRHLLEQGLVQLKKLTQQLGHTSFGALSFTQRESILRQFEKTHEGERWLALMLDLILEALLGDPVYGGNPNGMGWKWVNHRPGHPRPPLGKRYYEL